MYFTNISSLGLDFIRLFIWTHLIPLNMKRDILKGVLSDKNETSHGSVFGQPQPQAKWED